MDLMSDLEAFLRHNVEGYLFGDLREMQKIEVGYPLLMTTFAGIELMGALLSSNPFQAHSRGADYFKSYWKGYLYPNLTDSEMIGGVLYQLMRHGIAHGFVLKGPIGVVRNEPVIHLRRDTSGIIYVDAVRLADDFMASYSVYVKPLVTSDTATGATSIGQRLAEMDSAYQAQASKLSPLSAFAFGPIAETAAISQSITPNNPSTIGPSGPSGPTFGSKLPSNGP
jgi:hypothetical protein